MMFYYNNYNREFDILGLTLTYTFDKMSDDSKIDVKCFLMFLFV